MSSDSSSGSQRAVPPTSTPQLSCELCRERKVKCDKLEPCTTCVTANVECISIFRQRLPRGRHTQKKTTAVDQTQQRPKQSRRESHQLQQQQRRNPQSSTQTKTSGSNTDNNGACDAGNLSSIGQTSNGQVEDSRSSSTMAAVTYSRPNESKSKQSSISSLDFQQPLSPLLLAESDASVGMASSFKDMASMTSDEMFWIDSLGSKFDEPSKHGYTVGDLGNASLLAPDVQSFDFGTGPFKMLCAAKQDTAPAGLPSISSVTTRRLFQVYLEQVDPVIKILHRPCLTRFMEHGEPYLDFPEGHASVTALSAAVCYAAACSLSETQCRATFQESKASMISLTQAVCESALERADVLTATDLTVLQAFVLYLVGRRSKEQGRVVWSLVPLLVRLAKGIFLNVNPLPPVRGCGESFFDRQMRKRLWLTICVMDLQASFAYGSEPLIHAEEVSGALDGLRHVNDSEFGPSTTNDLKDKEELTDVTFPFVAFLAQVSGRLLHYASRHGDADAARTRSSSNSSSIGARSRDAASASFLMDQNARERMSAAFEQKAFTLLRFCNPEDSHQAWFTWHGTQALVAATRLAAIRPSQQAKSGTDDAWAASVHHDQRVDAELELGVRILEKFRLMHSDPRSEGLRWYMMVPWQALGVVVAGCGVSNDEALIRRAWPLVEYVWQAQQSQSGSHDQKAVASQMESKIRQARDVLRPLLEPGKPSATDGRSDSVFGSSSTSTFSTPLRTPTMGPLTHPHNMSYFPLTSGTTAADSFRVPSNTAATASSNAHSQLLPQKPLSNTSIQDMFGAPNSFNLGRSMPLQQVNDPQFQAWDDAMMCNVDYSMNDIEVDMTGGYSGCELMPL